MALPLGLKASRNALTSYATVASWEVSQSKMADLTMSLTVVYSPVVRVSSCATS